MSSAALRSSSASTDILPVSELRYNVSDERVSGSGVSGGCEMLSWLLWPCSRKLSLVAESWNGCNMSQSACDELCGQGSARMSMSSGCFGCMVFISVLVECVSHMMTLKLKRSPVVTYYLYVCAIQAEWIGKHH